MTVTITGCVPSSLALNQSALLTINGTNFVNGGIVRLDGSQIPSTFVSSTQMTATAPASAVAKTVQIQVRGVAGEFSANFPWSYVGVTKYYPNLVLVGGPPLLTQTRKRANFTWVGAKLVVASSAVAIMIPQRRVSEGLVPKLVMAPGPPSLGVNTRTVNIRVKQVDLVMAPGPLIPYNQFATVMLVEAILYPVLARYIVPLISGVRIVPTPPSPPVPVVPGSKGPAGSQKLRLQTVLGPPVAVTPRLWVGHIDYIHTAVEIINVKDVDTAIDMMMAGHRVCVPTFYMARLVLQHLDVSKRDINLAISAASQGLNRISSRAL